MRLSEATPADAAQIADVFREARAAMVYLPESPHTLEQTVEFFSRLVLDPGTLVLIARAPEGRIRGFGVFGEGCLDHLYVRPEDQRQGIGSDLIRAAKARFDRLEGWVFEKNTQAIELYGRHGFVVIERTDGSQNEEREPDVRIGWSRVHPERADETTGFE